MGALVEEVRRLKDATVSQLNRLHGILDDRIRIIEDRGYNATNDILVARARPDYAGDQVALNAALAAHKAVYVTPEVGFIDVAATIVLGQYCQRLVLMGGWQAIPVIRRQAMTGSTMIVGAPIGVPAGSAYVENVWFIHPGRGPAGDYVEGTALAHRLTNYESHLELWRAQGATLRNIGGYGCVHGISVYGSSIVSIENPLFFGGVWDPDLPSAQEAISHIHLANNAPSLYNTNISITNPTTYGPVSSARRAVTVGGKTVQVSRRLGPRYSLLVRGGEDVAVMGGFLSGASRSAVCISADSPDPVFNVGLSNVDIDESNMALVEVGASEAYVVDGVFLNGCRLNGQIITTDGILVGQNGAGANSLRRLKVHGTNIRAVLGAGMRLAGVESGEINGSAIAGYNCATTTDQLQGGIVIFGTTSNLDTTNTRFGGGLNSLSEPNVPDAYGITANGTKYGLVNLGAGANVTQGRLLSAPFGQSGGALSLGTFAADPL